MAYQVVFLLHQPFPLLSLTEHGCQGFTLSSVSSKAWISRPTSERSLLGRPSRKSLVRSSTDQPDTNW